MGILLIWQFTSGRTTEQSLRTNQKDLDAFIRALPGCPSETVSPGQLVSVSPITTDRLPPAEGTPYADIELLVGKLTMAV